MRKRGQHCVGLYQNCMVKQFLEETEELCFAIVSWADTVKSYVDL